MKAKKMKLGIVTVALSFSLFAQPSPSFAQPTNMTPTQQIDAFQTQIQQFDNKIVESMEKVDELNKEIKKTEKDVEETKKEVKKAEEEFEIAKELYLERLQTIQESGGSNYLTFVNVLLESDGLSDLIQRTTAIKMVLDSDQQVIETFNEKEKKLKKKEKQLKENVALLKEKKEEAIKEKLSIESQKKEIEEKLKRAKDVLALQKKKAVQLPVNVSNLHFASDKAKIVIRDAQQYLGVPYLWGGTTPSGFDCSGLLQYVYRNVGVELPRVSRDQQNYGTPIPVNQVQPGDLVFWGKPAYHVGVYIGNGQFLHAPQTGDVVKISNYNPSGATSATRVLH